MPDFAVSLYSWELLHVEIVVLALRTCAAVEMAHKYLGSSTQYSTVAIAAAIEEMSGEIAA